MSGYVIEYKRQSTQAQTDKFGKDVQRGKIVEALKARGLKADKRYTDVCDGHTLERNLLQKVLQYSDAGKAGAVAVASLCRLSRNPIQIAEVIARLRDGGTRLISADECFDTNDAPEEQVAALAAFIVQINTAHRLDNLERGKTLAVKNGFPGFGRPTFGYRYENGEFVIVPEQAKIISKIFNLGYKEYTFRGIANRLNQKGISSPHEKEWTHKTVSRILRNPIYIGLLVRTYMGEEEATFKESYAIVGIEKATHVAKKWLEKVRTAKSSI